MKYIIYSVEANGSIPRLFEDDAEEDIIQANLFRYSQNRGVSVFKETGTMTWDRFHKAYIDHLISRQLIPPTE